MPEISNTDDIIEISDLRRRIHTIRRTDLPARYDTDWAEILRDAEELVALTDLMTTLPRSAQTPYYDGKLIHHDHLEDYAREKAEAQHGDVDCWPFNHIDWSAAADELGSEMTEVDFNGTEYFAEC